MPSSVETSDGSASRTRLRAAAAGSQDSGNGGAAEASVDSSGSASDLAGTVVAAILAMLLGLVGKAVIRRIAQRGS